MQRSILLQQMCYPQPQVWSIAIIIYYSKVNFRITVGVHEYLSLFLFQKAPIHILSERQIGAGKLILVIVVSDIYIVVHIPIYIYIASICNTFLPDLFYNRSTKTWMNYLFMLRQFFVLRSSFIKIFFDENTYRMNNCLNHSHKQIRSVADGFVVLYICEFKFNTTFCYNFKRNIFLNVHNMFTDWIVIFSIYNFSK